jgi:hypothetical protein
MTMLVKREAHNRVTLPEELVRELDDPDYFEAAVDGGKLVFSPLDLAPGHGAFREDALERIEALWRSCSAVSGTAGWSREEIHERS